MDQAEAFALAALRDYASWSLIFVILTLIERISAKQPTSLAGRVAGLMFWAVWIPVSLAITTALSALWAWLGIAPLLTLDIVQALGWAGPFAVAGAVLLGLVVGDFFAYWFHRAQHAWLWRFHAVHHSITDLNAVNSYHHASEAFFNTIIVALPISLVMVNYGPTIPLIGMIIWFQVVFLHSPTNVNFGFLRVIVADNRFHRIHHSMERHHFDRNFAITFSFWDRLFGTAYYPKQDEWPAVGLAEIAQPQSVREWIDLPFRYRAEAAVDEDMAAKGAPA
jgi:sterol desaturase/sphingolipid hydroxylase (fatty acid hydroxylase superfamily)